MSEESDHRLQFCPNCGTDLRKRRCSGCGELLIVEAEYCHRCGLKAADEGSDWREIFRQVTAMEGAMARLISAGSARSDSVRGAGGGGRYGGVGGSGAAASAEEVGEDMPF